MGGSDSEELEGNKLESMLPPKAHVDKEEETVIEARARVDKLWRTILATGNNNSEGRMKEPSQRGGKITLTDWDEPVEMERHPPRAAFNSSHDLRRPMESIAKTESPSHPVEDFHERLLPYLDNSTQSLSASSAYGNFLYGPCIPSEHAKRPDTVPVRPTPNHAASSSFGADNDLLINLSFTAVVPASERTNLDMGALLQQQLGNTCPRSSQFLTSIVASVEEAVEEHRSGSGTSRGLSSDFDEEEEEGFPEQKQVSEHEQDHLKAAITEHPLYPTMVLAHIGILKIGAPSGLQVKLDEITKKFQRFEVASDNSKLGEDPELDRFMRSYTELLTRFREDLEEPFNKLMQFMNSATKDLEDICGHYVDTKPDEEDNYGYDIAPGMDATHDSDEQEMLEESLLNPIDVDESIIVDPDASEEELKKVLMKKYGRHIGGLKAEFNRVRKKGKLPSGSRQILKDWFNRHSYWPYPSEMEKAYLQRLCNLDLKQINNWFINERKRHWSSEEKCMQDPNSVYYDLRTNPDGEGTSHQEQ